MKLKIDPFDKKSIDTAIKQLQQYQTDFKEKEREFQRKLGEIGIQVARTGFALADYDGMNDVTVELVPYDGGYSVVAKGQTVGFIEFGTGVRYPNYDSSEIPYTPPPRGSYGKGHGKNPKGWYFAPHPGAIQHTYGNPPAEAMLEARNTMIERVVQIALEVWRT